MYLRKKILFIFLIFTVLAAFSSISQPYYFRHYQVEDGLSNSTVFAYLQDKKGFIWMGTKDGLNRFDGYSFKIFRNNPGDSLSIGSNCIKALFQDKNGKIYVGTTKGLYRYNDSTENFAPINPGWGDVRDIKTDNYGNLWYIHDFTLYKYNTKDESLQKYDRNTYFDATSICVAGNGDVWVSTNRGTLEKYNKTKNSFTKFDVFPVSKPLGSKWIEKIYYTSKNTILVGTSSHGVKLFDPETSSYKNILTYNADKTAIYARDFIENNAHEYWIATESGIFVYNTLKGDYINLKKNYNDPYAISDNAVYALCKDAEGGIWAGTYFGGTNYYPERNAVFKKYFPQNAPGSLSGNAVREICQDKNGNFWIGTEDAGLNKLNPQTDVFTNYKPTGAKTDIAYYNIHGLLATGDKLWIGTFEHGLDIMDLHTEKVIRHYDTQSGQSGLLNNFVVTIYQTRAGEILIGTPSGIQRYNVSADSFSTITEIPPCFVYSVTEDHAGNIWAATIGNGVYYFNPETKKTGNIRHEPDSEKSLSNDAVNTLIEDSNHNMWFGTEGGGLCMYDAAKKIITKRYNIENGLPSNYIFKILEDSNKILWITTSKGLVSLNPATGKLSTYTRANGLLADQFNYNSGFAAADGKMYFGCLKGFVSMRPTDFTTNTHPAPLLITGFQVYNKELSINEEGSPLTRSIIYSDKITLEHNQSSFSIDFASLSFTAPETSEYKYKMESLDKDWTFLKTNRKAYFTQLRPGNYVFRVKSTNNHGVWNNPETTIEIEILPPFWASTVAYLLYIAISIIILYVLIYFYQRRTAEKNKREKEIFENEKQRQIYQLKTDFFTNVAHEIRTPLTLIKAPLERIVKKASDDPDIGNNIRIMERNTNRLIELTNQLLDFKRIETDKFKLDFEKVNITEILNERFSSFWSVTEQENKRLKLIISPGPIHARVDVDAFHKILNNLFNNAIKYCYREVTVRLYLNEEENYNFTIEFRNDGHIITSAMKEKIFEPFYRLAETKKKTGSGIGLALSRSLAELHHGHLYLQEPDGKMNVFVLTMPLLQPVESNIINQPAFD